MSRLRSASHVSSWSGPFEPRRRDIHGEATEAWAADERRQRAAGIRHGITEAELLALLSTAPAASAIHSLAA